MSWSWRKGPFREHYRPSSFFPVTTLFLTLQERRHTHLKHFLTGDNLKRKEAASKHPRKREPCPEALEDEDNMWWLTSSLGSPGREGVFQRDCSGRTQELTYAFLVYMAEAEWWRRWCDPVYRLSTSCLSRWKWQILQSPYLHIQSRQERT